MSEYIKGFNYINLFVDLKTFKLVIKSWIYHVLYYIQV